MKRHSVKTVLSAALAVSMLTTASFAAAGVDLPMGPGPQISAYTVNQRGAAFIRVWGAITEKGEARITLKNSNESDPYREIVVSFSEETVLLDAVTGEDRAFDDLAQGETVYAYVGPAMTRSLPPIANGVLVLCNIPADYAVPTYAEVHSVAAGDEGSISALTDADVVLHLNGDTQLTAHRTKNVVALGDIRPGTRVLAWYSTVALSLPAQAWPTKVMVFPAVYEGYVQLGERGIVLDGDMAIDGVIADGRLLLPVRTVAEAMGHTVEWVNESCSVVVSKGEHAYTLAIGGDAVDVDGSGMALTAAPQLIDGVSHVALDDLLVLHNLKLAQ